MVTVTIDGKEIETSADSMLIEAADQAGIHIPRFCYHKKLSIAANCRMCLVEVERSGKPLPACATPVADGMKVYTQSAKTREAQQAVMEFLLINHPLDCPVCDQGGQCELQDFSMQFGAGDSRFKEQKRAVEDEQLGALVATEMTRCIHCTRCVRFSREIAGVHDLGATGRGEATQIGTYVQKTLSSELSGNIIDVCPVGALTSKPFRFSARTWELNEHAGIAAHDCLGSNINFHTLRDEVMRVVPREHEEINEVWLSDRDRFSYLGLRSDDRVTSPMLKQAGEWQTVSWQDALQAACAGIKRVLGKAGASQLGALASANSSVEELYLLQRLLRALGSSHIDHRWQQLDASDDERSPLFPQLGTSIASLQDSDAVLFVGSHLRHEQPLLGARVRQAALDGSQICFINPIALDLNFSVYEEVVVDIDNMVPVLAGVAKALISGELPPEAAMLAEVVPTPAEQRMAEALAQGVQTHVILGAFALNHPQAALLKSLAQLIAELSLASFGVLTPGANSAGAWLAGAVPHRQAGGQLLETQGLALDAMLQAKLRAYIVYNLEPEFDCQQAKVAVDALKSADFVVCCSPYRTDAMRDYADLILPIAPVSETPGTFVNAEGLWQTFAAAVHPLGEARPGWKVLRVMGNLLDVADFEYDSCQQIHDELLHQCQDTVIKAGRWQLPHALPIPQQQLAVLVEWPLYRGDAIVRRSQALQAVPHARGLGLYLHPDLAKQLQLQADQIAQIQSEGEKIELQVYLEQSLPKRTVLIPKSFAKTMSMHGHCSLEISRG